MNPKTITTPSVFNRVQSVLADLHLVPNVAVTPDSQFLTDFGMDSLDNVEFIMALEDHFRIELSDEECESVSTVGQAVALVEKHLANAHPAPAPKNEVTRQRAAVAAFVAATQKDVQSVLTNFADYWKKALSDATPAQSVSDVCQQLQDVLQRFTLLESGMHDGTDAQMVLLQAMGVEAPAVVEYEAQDMDTQMDWVGYVRAMYPTIGPEEASRLARRAYDEHDGLMPVLA